MRLLIIILVIMGLLFRFFSLVFADSRCFPNSVVFCSVGHWSKWGMVLVELLQHGQLPWLL